ncbi:MAG: hypothetical protein HQM11_01315 [SAR324 cluster bacterium]|nr:hypothetical protein [SAR324 cluster bacterium]
MEFEQITGQIQDIDQELAQYSSGFVQQFRYKLSQSTEHLLRPMLARRQHPMPRQFQKAVIHGLQLYHVEDTLKLISNHDPSQGIVEGIRTGVHKSFSSLSAIPLLRKVILTPRESQELEQYREMVEHAICRAFHCSQQDLHNQSTMLWAIDSNIAQLNQEQARRFFRDRLGLLFSPAYFSYLILRNRYFFSKLIHCACDPEIESWIRSRIKLIPEPDAERRPLDHLLSRQDFRTLERLAREMTRRFEGNDRLTEDAPPLRLMEDDSQVEANQDMDSDDSTILKVVAFYDTPGVPTLKETPPQPTVLEQGPEIEMERSPFEWLCFSYARHILGISKHFSWVKECSSPYFRSKSEDYISDMESFFEGMFGSSPMVLNDFTDYVTRLLEYTTSQNPFPGKKETIPLWAKIEDQWQIQGQIEREREWSLMLKSRTTFPITLVSEGPRPLNVQQGLSFVIQMGIAHFDYDQPKHKKNKTRSCGFFKILFQGRVLSPHSAVIYIGKIPYYMLTSNQLQQCRHLFFLCLLSARHTFSVELPPLLKNYLVQILPELLPQKSSPLLSVLHS